MKFTDCIEIVGSKPTLYEGTKQYVSTGAVEEYFINEKSIEEYSYKERPSRADLVGKSGDILFAKMAETKKTLILDKETENYLFSTGFFAIRPKNGILTTKCLYYLLNSKNFLSQKDKNSSGATQKAITNAGLEKININIPLFSKQDQIVKQFDLLTDIIKKYQSQLKKLDSLIKSRFIEMFGDNPIENGKWRIKELCSLSEIGSSKRIFANEYVSEGIPFYRSKEIRELGNGERPSIELYISCEKYNEIKTKYGIPKKNEILIAAIGATIGYTWIIDTDSPFYYKDGNLILISNIRELNSIFLNEILKIEIQTYKQKTSGSAQLALTIEKMEKLQIPVPPLSLQNDFAALK